MTSGAAQAEALALAERTNRDNPNINTFNPRITPLREHVSGQLRSAMLVLVCAVGLVMMIVCANLSNLLLARAATREKEIAIRAALGAGRRRLIRQMLTESLALSLCGAAVGLALGASAGNLRTLILTQTLKLAAVGMALGLVASWLLGRTLQGLLFGVAPSDPMTFAAALVILMAVAALAGYLPAMRASRLDPVESLRAE